MQAHNKMIDSGVDWLGKVPASWRIVPPRILFSERREKSQKDDIHLTPSQKYGVLPQSEYMELTGGRVVLNLIGSDNMKHVEIGDFVIHLRSFQGGIEYSSYAGKVSNAYTVLSPRGDIEDSFFKYVLKSHGFISELASKTDQMRDGQSIKYSTFSLVRLPWPNTTIQQKITDFLNTETIKINELIGKQERLLALLEEKRRATITHAVTRGLNPKVELQETNIPWLGNIPAHWNIYPLYRYVRENRRLNKGMINNNVLSLSYGKVIEKNLDNGGLMPGSYETYQIVKPGDIVLRLTDLQNDHTSLRVGHSAYEGIITSAYVDISSPNYMSKYLYYLLHAYDLLKVFYNLGGGLRQGMKFSDVKRLPALNLSIDEQKNIVQFLELKESQTDELRQKIGTQINLLKERRISLIHHAVTGKLKV